MQVTRYIERHGFRRWYERQLIESHAYLALGFVALILLLSGLELLSDVEGGMRYVIVLTAAAAVGMLLVVAWRRFGVLLARAEHFGEAATCPQCKAWGKFKVLAQETSSADDPPEAGRPHWLNVRCKQCDAVWKLQ
jgi:ssDNA-binding Zn-finger/Zn-ribbon topoisomerase 1